MNEKSLARVRAHMRVTLFPMGLTVQRDSKGGKGLEAWEFGDPLLVAERRELQANAAVARELEKATQALAKLEEQQRIRDLVFKKAGTA